MAVLERTPSGAVATPARGCAPAARRRRYLEALGAAVLLALGLAALLAPLLAPHDPTAQSVAQQRLLPPGAPGHPLGTDHLGRDILSRLLYALRFSLGIALASVALGGVVGGVVGLLSGAVLGRTDLLVQRVVDVVMTFPMVVLALGVVAALGASAAAVTVAIAVAYTPLAVRVTRAAALAARGRAYVDAARALGASEARIIWRHVAPECLAPWLVLVSAEVGTAVLAESALSFLGLGAQEPLASLGGMVGGAALQYLEEAPWLALWPGLVLTLLVLGANLAGDGLRDLADPRLRRQDARR